MTKKKILITGGCGFIGRHFTKRLCEAGNEVTVVDDLSNGLDPVDWPLHLQPPESNAFYFDKKDCREWFKEHTEEQFDLVIHLAAIVGGREIIENQPAKNIENISLDAEFFEWAINTKQKNVVFMSSPVVYPVNLQDSHHDVIPLEESLVDLSTDWSKFGMPDLIYGWAKLTGERLAALAASKYGMNVLCPRPFSGYGEDQDMSYPTPAICKRAVDKENPLTIWGSGTQGRDFIYVEDIISAIIRKIDEGVSGYQTMNIGWGKLVTFKELAEMAAKIVGYEPEVTNLSDKPEGVKNRVASISKLSQTFYPRHNLKDGLTRVIRFLREEPLEYEYKGGEV